MDNHSKVDCAAAMRQLWDFLDEELSPERMTEMRAHLERCQRCNPHYDFEKALLEAISCTRPDCCAPQQLREKLAEKLRSAGFEGAI
jgi:anti-sigma factor (TIGR02949 family)